MKTAWLPPAIGRRYVMAGAIVLALYGRLPAEDPHAVEPLPASSAVAEPRPLPEIGANMDLAAPPTHRAPDRAAWLTAVLETLALSDTSDEPAWRRRVLQAIVQQEDPGARVFAPDEMPAAEAAPEEGPPFCETERLPRDLVRIAVKNMGSGAGLAIAASLDDAAHSAVGIVLDLRTTYGSSLPDILHVASRYAREGDRLYELRDRQGRTLMIERAVATGRTPAARPPMVVLVGPQTRGAAELLAAVLDRCPGVLTMGHATANDWPFREVVSLPDGWSVRLSTRRLVLADGETLEGAKPFVPSRVLPATFPPDPQASETTANGLDRRKTLPQEADDRALRERVRSDPALRYAVDLLLALAALEWRD